MLVHAYPSTVYLQNICVTPTSFSKAELQRQIVIPIVLQSNPQPRRSRVLCAKKYTARHSLDDSKEPYMQSRRESAPIVPSHSMRDEKGRQGV